MIKILDKHNCCGCLACLNACPKKCISPKTDAEGFSYPIADESICINCGICEKICPFLNPHKNSASPECFAMQRKNRRYFRPIFDRAGCIKNVKEQKFRTNQFGENTLQKTRSLFCQFRQPKSPQNSDKTCTEIFF